MNAAFGLRFAVDFFAEGFFAGAFFAGAFFAVAFFAAGFFAGAFFAAGFFAAFFAFLAVAIVLLPLSRCGTHCAVHSEAGRPVTGDSGSIGGNYSAIPKEGNPSQAVFSQCCERHVARAARRSSAPGTSTGSRQSVPVR